MRTLGRQTLRLVARVALAAAKLVRRASLALQVARAGGRAEPLWVAHVPPSPGRPRLVYRAPLPLRRRARARRVEAMHRDPHHGGGLFVRGLPGGEWAVSCGPGAPGASTARRVLGARAAGCTTIMWRAVTVEEASLGADRSVWAAIVRRYVGGPAAAALSREPAAFQLLDRLARPIATFGPGV